MKEFNNYDSPEVVVIDLFGKNKFGKGGWREVLEYVYGVSPFKTASSLYSYLSEGDVQYTFLQRITIAIKLIFNKKG